MGIVLISIGLIFFIIYLYREDVNSEHKFFVGCGGYLIFSILCLIFKVDMILLVFNAILASLSLRYKFYETKSYLIAICVFTVIIINSWGIIAWFTLGLVFDYGFFTSLFKGFGEMNNSFSFIVGIANEIILKFGIDSVTPDLIAISEETRKTFGMWDKIQAIFKILEYL